MGLDVNGELRQLLAEILAQPLAEILALPADTPLIVGGLGLSSLGGAQLLTQVNERFGVDVAGQDLTLRSLDSIATLVTFVESRRPVQD